MTIIAGASCLFAPYNSKDMNQRVAAALAFETASERMLLPEIACKLHHAGGQEAAGSPAREGPTVLLERGDAKRVNHRTCWQG